MRAWDLMKMILLSSFLCLGLGFLLGRMEGNPPDPEESPGPTLSDRKGGAPKAGRRIAGGEKNRWEELDRLIQKSDQFDGDHVEEARLQAWLLQLGLDEIPVALELILERERNAWEENESGWVNSNEFFHGRSIGADLQVLLARWYELEEDSALTWIQNQKIWTIGYRLEAEITMIADGYHRDPQRGLARVLGFLNRLKDVGVPNGQIFRDKILYQVARWDSTPLQTLERIDEQGELREPCELSSFPSGFEGPPAFWPNPAMKAFAQGLVDSGRVEMIHSMLGDLEGGALIEVEAVLAKQVEDKGWRYAKKEVDSGRVNASSLSCLEIANQMAQENREEALSWVLDQDYGEWANRGAIIARVLSESEIFKLERETGDPFADATVIDFDLAEKWLGDLVDQGEPLELAWSGLIESALLERDWERVRAYGKHIPEERWTRFEEEIIGDAIDVRTETVKGEELVFLSKRTHGMGDRVVREFGLTERMEARIKAANSEARSTLQVILDDLE